MTNAATVALLLDQDELDDALAAAQALVKDKPGERDARNLYIDLLILSGDLDRADAQCNLAATFAPEDALGFGLLRRQLRGLVARAAWFSDGAVPEFPGGPSDLDQLALRAGVALREGEGDKAKALIDQLDEARGERPMHLDAAEVADLRDLDDRLPHALEVVTTGGAYLWIDFAKIATLTLAPIRRPRDLALRYGELRLTDGATASVLIPALYSALADDKAGRRLGRETDFTTLPGGLVIGHGQRCLLAGDASLPFHTLTTLVGTATDAGDASHGIAADG